MFFKSTYFFVFVFFVFLMGESSSSTTALDLWRHLYRKWNINMKLTANEILWPKKYAKWSLIKICFLHKKSPKTKLDYNFIVSKFLWYDHSLVKQVFYMPFFKTQKSSARLICGSFQRQLLQYSIQSHHATQRCPTILYTGLFLLRVIFALLNLQRLLPHLELAQI